MAMKIKSHYDLSTLRVELLADDDPPAVRCTLEFTRDHLPEIAAEWQVSTADLGLPSMLDCAESHGRGYPFELPGGMAAELGGRLADDAFPGRPLWLHLVKPYGNLGVLPWEQMLAPHLPVPMLRLPDFIVEPVRSRRSITVVLCADDGPGAPDEQADTIAALAATISHSIPLPATVHIFTSAQLYDLLRARKSAVGWADQVLLHDPSTAVTGGRYAGQPKGYAGPEESTSSDSAVRQDPNAWLDWIRDAMCGESVDVMHFLAPAVIRLDQGALTLTGSPGGGRDTGLSVIPTAALTRFTMQLGAWACVFSSPHGNPSEMGLRLVATTLADLRPTTLMHHELRLDPGLTALGDGYRLITSPAPGRPPADPSVFLYCQPFQVVTEPRKDELLTAAAPVAEPSAKVRSLLADASTPTWVSTSQRYVEQYEWRLHQWQDPEQIPAPEVLSTGVARALELIQGVVDRYADAPTPTLDPAPVVDISAREQP